MLLSNRDEEGFDPLPDPYIFELRVRDSGIVRVNFDVFIYITSIKHT